ncbi:MAG: hypothetical protein M3O25_04680, partial [Actinomycetota bacterium]|nr:hypothetical protein [Actinomycetota bacterium]
LLAAGNAPKARAEAERCAGVARERGLLLPLPRTLRTLALARIELDEPGVTDALDEAAEVAERGKQLLELKLIEEQRRAVTAG